MSKCGKCGKVVGKRRKYCPTHSKTVHKEQRERWEEKNKARRIKDKKRYYDKRFWKNFNRKRPKPISNPKLTTLRSRLLQRTTFHKKKNVCCIYVKPEGVFSVFMVQWIKPLKSKELWFSFDKEIQAIEFIQKIKGSKQYRWHWNRA